MTQLVQIYPAQDVLLWRRLQSLLSTENSFTNLILIGPELVLLCMQLKKYMSRSFELVMLSGKS